MPRAAVLPAIRLLLACALALAALGATAAPASAKGTIVSPHYFLGGPEDNHLSVSTEWNGEPGSYSAHVYYYDSKSEIEVSLKAAEAGCENIDPNRVRCNNASITYSCGWLSPDLRYDMGAGNDFVSTKGTGVDAEGNQYDTNRVCGNSAYNGEEGNDTIIITSAYAGSSVVGGDGDDTIHLDQCNVGVDAGAGNDTVRQTVGTGCSHGIGANGIDLGPGDDFADAAAGNDDVKGGDGNDTIYGGHGHDTIRPGSGADSVYGGTGNTYGEWERDTVVYDDHKEALHVDLEGDRDDGSELEDGGRQDMIDETIEDITGGAGNDELIGDGDHNYIRAGGGDDLLDGRGGDDLLSGDGGVDTVSYRDRLLPVTVTLGDQGETVEGPNKPRVVGNDGEEGERDAVGYDGYYSAGNVENVIGGAAGDWLSGTNADNLLDGGPAAEIDDERMEILTGFGGNDHLGSAGGNFNIAGGDGTDVADFSGRFKGVAPGDARGMILDLELDTTDPQFADGLDVDGDGVADEPSVLSSDVENLVGSHGDDRLTGNAGDNVITGKYGTDVADGGDGHDTFDYAGHDHGVTADLEGDAGDGGPGEDDRIGADFENLYGTLYADDLTGDAGDNVLQGKLGADTLRGLGGLDTTSYKDRVSRSVPVTVDLDAPTGDDGVEGEGDFTHADVEGIIGGSGQDTLTGNAGDNVVDGGPGTDQMFGGGGRDTISYASRAKGASIYSTFSISLNGKDDDGDSDDNNREPENDHFEGFQDVIGSPLRDSIDGDKKPNHLDGGGGDDTVDGGYGADVVDGGAGKDRISDHESPYSSDPEAAPGIDVLRGGDDDDIIDGGGRDDSLYGGSGNDTLTAYDGTDTLYGNDGDDTLTAASWGSGYGYAATMYGGDGNDALTGSHSADWFDGGAGADVIKGLDRAYNPAYDNSGVDTVHYGDRTARVVVDADGEADDGEVGEGDFVALDIDVIQGGSGADDLRGGPSANTLIGGGGADDLHGGDGFDTVSYLDHSDPVTADLDGAEGDDGATAEGDTIRGDVEALRGGHGGDTLTGNDSRNEIEGGGGNDVLDAGINPTSNTESVKGGEGDDDITAGDGTQQIQGDEGHDEVHAGGGIDSVQGGDGDDTVDGGTGENYLNGDGGADKLTNPGGGSMYGGDGPDVLTGGTGKDDANGGDGSDVITGGAGDDTLSDGDQTYLGSSFVDQLYGGSGNDTLNSSAGSDLLDGGESEDPAQDVDSATYSRSTGVTADLDGVADDGAAGEAGNALNIEQLVGTPHDDKLTGDGGDNRLTGGGGTDELVGLGGADTLTDGGIHGWGGSEEHPDTFSGGAGDDRLVTVGGSDVLAGGEGVDTADYSARNGQKLKLDADGVADDGMISTWYQTPDETGNIATDVENLTGGDGDDQISGNAAVNVLTGNGGNDTLRSRDGVVDTVECGEGADDKAYGNAADTYAGCETTFTDDVPPDTQLTQTPGATSTDRVAQFQYSSAAEDFARFECRLDDGEFQLCGNDGYTSSSLSYGEHRFEVRAVDTSDNADATPALHAWTILDPERVGDGMVQMTEWGAMTYAGKLGEVNTVVIDVAGSTATLTDSTASGLTAGTGCTVDPQNARRVTCTNPNANPWGTNWSMTVKGNEGDDSLSLLSTNAPTNVTVTADLLGGAGNDVITGSRWNDTLDGGGGNDTLSGNGGDDSLDGGAGADDLDGGAHSDFPNAGDTVSYEDRYSDTTGVTIDFDGVADDGEALDEATIDGVTRRDKLAGLEKVLGTHKRDVISGDAAANHIVGNDGADELRGGGGADILDGGANGESGMQAFKGDGLDTLYGEGGDDVLRGGGDADDLDGGEGRDLAAYDDRRPYWGEPVTASHAVVVDLDGVADDGNAIDESPVNLTTRRDALVAIEDVEGGAGDDTLTGDGAGNRFLGGSGVNGGTGGDDALSGAGGDDTLVGGGFEGANSSSDGADTFDGGAGNDTLWATDKAVDGGTCGESDADADRAYLDLDPADTISDCESINPSGGGGGDPGNPPPAAGTVKFTEGQLEYSRSAASSETVSVTFSPTGAVVRDPGAPTSLGVGAGCAADATDATGRTVKCALPQGAEPEYRYLLSGTPGTDSFAIESNGDVWVSGAVLGFAGDDTINGSDGSESLVGGEGRDVLNGGAGSDMLAGGAGPDDLDGGTGSDTVDYTERASAIRVDLSDGVHDDGNADDSGTVAGQPRKDKLVAVENVFGGDGDDEIVGNTANNGLTGMGGADTLRGLAGTDELDGGFGHLSSYDASPDLGDTLEGGVGADRLAGGVGGDRFHGGSGVDLVDYQDHSSYVEHGGDSTAPGVVADLDGAAGDDGSAVDGSVGSRDTIHADVEELNGSEDADQLTGNDAANGIHGRGAGDVINGGGGDDELWPGRDASADVVDGGAGDDTFVPQPRWGDNDENLTDGNDRFVGGDGDNDTISYEHWNAAVTVRLDGTANDGIAGEADDVEADVENVEGGSGDDHLFGPDTATAENYLDGGPGADELRGGAGPDTLDGGHGTAADQLHGDGGDDELHGGAGADQLHGGGGRDVVDARDQVRDTGSCGADGDIAFLDGIDELTECEPAASGQVPPESDLQIVEPGGTGGTDDGEDGVDESDGADVSITSPAGGTISASESPLVTTAEPADIDLLDIEMDLSAPDATADAPLVLRITLDQTLVAAGVALDRVEVLRNAAVLADCSGYPRAADALGAVNPTPACVARRDRLQNVNGTPGDVVLTVVTTAASIWNVGVRKATTEPDPDPDTDPDTDPDPDPTPSTGGGGNTGGGGSTGGGTAPAADTTAPLAALKGPASLKASAFAAKGAAFQLTCSEACAVTYTLALDARTAKKLKLKNPIGKGSATAAAGVATKLTFKVSGKAKAKLKKKGKKAKITVTVVVADAAGNTSTVKKTIKLK